MKHDLLLSPNNAGSTMRSEAFLYWIIEVGVRSRIANRDGRWEAEEEAGEVNVLCGVEVNVRWTSMDP